MNLYKCKYIIQQNSKAQSLLGYSISIKGLKDLLHSRYTGHNDGLIHIQKFVQKFQESHSFYSV